MALFNVPSGENLFLDRVFDLFDEKKNSVIEFGEFVHAISVFHPNAPLEDKIDCKYGHLDPLLLTCKFSLPVNSFLHFSFIQIV